MSQRNLTCSMFLFPTVTLWPPSPVHSAPRWELPLCSSMRGSHYTMRCCAAGEIPSHSMSYNERGMEVTEVMLKPPLSIDYWVDIHEVHGQLCLHLAGYPSNGTDPFPLFWAFRSQETIKKISVILYNTASFSAFHWQLMSPLWALELCDDSCLQGNCAKLSWCSCFFLSLGYISPSSCWLKK